MLNCDMIHNLSYMAYNYKLRIYVNVIIISSIYNFNSSTDNLIKSYLYFKFQMDSQNTLYNEVYVWGSYHIIRRSKWPTGYLQ